MSHVTRTPLSRSKGQRSSSQEAGHIVAASRPRNSIQSCQQARQLLQVSLENAQ